MKELIERLERERDLTNAEFAVLLDQSSGADRDFLFERARAVRDAHYGRKVYIRGLIELTNYCKNDCLYCGIRKSNASCERYRLTKEQILSCCESGYALGFRTFADKSYVTFRDLTDEEITEYLRKGESFDKAGAYGIQGTGGRMLVHDISGDFYNVVGLPIARVARAIQKLS
mgnify:CR=1 FL=1